MNKWDRLPRIIRIEDDGAGKDDASMFRKQTHTDRLRKKTSTKAKIQNMDIFFTHQIGPLTL